MTQSLGRFFDSELIARLSRMELTAQRIVDGFLAGKNRSSRHGFSIEFVEHREYVVGDDLRHLDWKVLGRKDRYYIKRYEEETNITATLLLDASASMTYASDGFSKFEAGATVATALGYLLNRQRDAVGLALFDEELREYVPPTVKTRGLASIVARLHGSEPAGKSTLAPVIERVAAELPGRCLIVIVSDLFVSPEEIEKGLKFLRYQGHDALVVQVLDQAEREFPFRSNVLFRGLEDRRRLLVEPHRLRNQYLAALEGFLAEARKACEKCGFDHVLHTTNEPLAPVLAAALAARSRRKRVAGGSRGR